MIPLWYVLSQMGERTFHNPSPGMHPCHRSMTADSCSPLNREKIISKQRPGSSFCPRMIITDWSTVDHAQVRIFQRDMQSSSSDTRHGDPLLNTQNRLSCNIPEVVKLKYKIMMKRRKKGKTDVTCGGRLVGHIVTHPHLDIPKFGTHAAATQIQADSSSCPPCCRWKCHMRRIRKRCSSCPQCPSRSG